MQACHRDVRSRGGTPSCPEQHGEIEGGPPQQEARPTCLGKAVRRTSGPSAGPIRTNLVSHVSLDHLPSNRESSSAGQTRDAGAGPVGPRAPAPQGPCEPWPSHTGILPLREPVPSVSWKIRPHEADPAGSRGAPATSGPAGRSDVRTASARRPGTSATSRASAWASTCPGPCCRSPTRSSGPCRASRRASCARRAPTSRPRPRRG